MKKSVVIDKNYLLTIRNMAIFIMTLRLLIKFQTFLRITLHRFPSEMLFMQSSLKKEISQKTLF